MKNSTPKKISEILQDSHLTRIIEKANFINELHDTVMQVLPVAYRELCQVTNLIDNQLVISVQSATIRQGLLLQQTALLRQIQTHLPEITQLEFKINPNLK